VKPFTVVTSKMVSLLQDNIDTDQIIPARFLKVTGREGLGEHLFEDLRRAANGSQRDDFPLNRPEVRGASILLAGANFGCGSSREHAPWALTDFGFRAVLGNSRSPLTGSRLSVFTRGWTSSGISCASKTRSLRTKPGTRRRVRHEGQNRSSSR
jgi:hypothetical protein